MHSVSPIPVAVNDFALAQSDAHTGAGCRCGGNAYVHHIVDTMQESDDPDRERRMRDAASDPQLRAYHEALLAARENATRTDLSATDQQRRQMLMDYRLAVAEADYLRARLLAWHPWLLDGDPLTQLHGVALDLDVLADTLEAWEGEGLAADVRDAASAVRAAVGGAMGPLP